MVRQPVQARCLLSRLGLAVAGNPQRFADRRAHCGAGKQTSVEKSVHGPAPDSFRPDVPPHCTSTHSTAQVGET